MYKAQKTMIKKYRTPDTDGISIRDQKKLVPELSKKKYQVNIKLHNGKVRYLYLNDPIVAELYVEIINATILKVKKL